jgi:DNA-binding NtrC family response regulator
VESGIKKPYRILFVDDEESILFAMREYFSIQGYDVDCAQEMEEAEALLAKVCYSLAVVDLQLTGLGGAEGLEIIGYICERYPSVKVILLTAYGGPEIEMEARRRGVGAFLHKPMPLPEVAQTVSELLRDCSL